MDKNGSVITDSYYMPDDSFVQPPMVNMNFNNVKNMNKTH
jgi:hypothetical protein